MKSEYFFLFFSLFICLFSRCFYSLLLPPTYQQIFHLIIISFVSNFHFTNIIKNQILPVFGKLLISTRHSLIGQTLIIKLTFYHQKITIFDILATQVTVTMIKKVLATYSSYKMVAMWQTI